ncbi:MAG TPA: helix-turn-helix domain-containing protein [Acidimicrobiia bacterium]|nr:helix-turn-helix domain-containing protein [Acidimicrobiia bacterium]
MPVDEQVPEAILDAARACFLERGIEATTMAAVAEQAGISRVWLYRHVENRDHLVTAVVRREAQRFLEGVRARLEPGRGPVEVVTHAFAHAICTLRHHDLLQTALRSEPEKILPFLTVQATPMLRAGASAVAVLLEEHAGLDTARARRCAEWLVRFAASTVLTPDALIDLDDEEELEALVRGVLGPLLEHQPGPHNPSGELRHTEEDER